MIFLFDRVWPLWHAQCSVQSRVWWLVRGQPADMKGQVCYITPLETQTVFSSEELLMLPAHMHTHTHPHTNMHAG